MVRLEVEHRLSDTGRRVKRLSTAASRRLGSADGATVSVAANPAGWQLRVASARAVVSRARARHAGSQRRTPPSSPRPRRSACFQRRS